MPELHAPEGSAPTRTRYRGLQGKRVLVTGGATGIGAAIVQAFAEQGAFIVFIDIRDEDAEFLCACLAPAQGPVSYVHCDLRDHAATASAVEAISRNVGPPEILVNNVANDERHDIADVGFDYWIENLQINLFPAIACALTVAPAMASAGAGVIINLGSIAPHIRLAGLPAYLTAKGGIEGFSRALARELGGHGVRVATVVPGAVDTDRQRRTYPTDESQLYASQCLRRRVTPQDVAALVMFLSSDDAAACTGHEYYVDGGWA